MENSCTHTHTHAHKDILVSRAATVILMLFFLKLLINHDLAKMSGNTEEWEKIPRAQVGILNFVCFVSSTERNLNIFCLLRYKAQKISKSSH